MVRTELQADTLINPMKMADCAGPIRAHLEGRALTGLGPDTSILIDDSPDVNLIAPLLDRTRREKKRTPFE